MVFLRLTVKVFPRDQPSPSTFSRSIIPWNRDRDDSSKSSTNTLPGNPASFLIVLEEPEKVTLGGLAGMIQEKWQKLRPDAGHLEIKKLVDDEHDSDDLDADLTVADVFVDNGKARVDSLDQRRTVRVIQKPVTETTTHAPVRFPSVTQDWEAAAHDWERIKKEKMEEIALNKLPTISEFDERRRNSGSQTSPVTDVTGSLSNSIGTSRRRDLPVSSVETFEIPGSPSQAARKSPFRGDTRHLRSAAGITTPRWQKRMESQELGDSPPPMRAPTSHEELTSPRHDSTHSQNSVIQSSVDVIETDSPALQLERESQSTASPQKSLPPLEKQPSPSSSEEVTESEDESDKTNEDSSSDEIAPDNDGDVPMGDGIKVNRNKQSASPSKPHANATAENETHDSSTRQTISLKRKNSEDILRPNKEPRLNEKGRATTPTTNKIPEKPSTPKSVGAPNLSPTGVRRERTPSFSGVNRRLSYSGPTESTKLGLGLGITRSPPKQPPVVLDLSQDSAQSGDEVPMSTPFIPSSEPTDRRGSFSRNISTPANVQTPADKVKNLHSALRKDASCERSSERRSVSFVEGDDVFITGSAQALAKPTLQITVKPAGSTPVPRANSEKRLSGVGTVVYPAGVPQERIDQLMKEAEEKQERQKKEQAFYEEKMKTAEEGNANPKYIDLLKKTHGMWQNAQVLEKRGRRSDETTVTKLRNQIKQQLKQLEKLEKLNKPEASVDKEVPQTNQPKKKAQSSKVSPQVEIDPKVKNSNGDPTKIDTPKVAPTSTAVGNSGVEVTPWKAINKALTSAASTPKQTDPTTNGITQPKSAPKPTPRSSTPTSKLKPSIAAKSAPNQSQSSNESDDLELPTMESVQRRASKPNKTPQQEPVEVSTSSESSSSEEDSSLDEEDETSGSSTSSSSEDESEAETKQPAPKSKPTRTTNGPSSQTGRPTRSSAPSSQLPPASETWGFSTRSQSQNNRVTLAGLKGQLKSGQTLVHPPSRPANAAPRKSVFSPPDSDSDETEEKSSSSESESDSDSDSDKEKDKGNDSDESHSGDEGDIMSSGQVRKLANPRRR